MLDHQLLRKSKPFFSVITGIIICLLGSAIWMSQTPHNVQWGDEPLIVFDHISQIKSGAGIGSLNYARIPSLVPDYILAYITSLITPSIRLQYFWFMLLTGGLQIFMMSALVKQVTKSTLLYSALLVSIIGYTLGAVNENIAFNLSFARYPVNHGGNLILVLLAANLFLSSSLLSRKESLSIKQAGQITLNFFGVVSNRIFIPQATIPLILGNIYRYANAPKNDANKQKLCVVIISIIGSTLIALLASEFAINTGCTPPISTSIEGFQGVIQGMFKDKNTLATSSGFIICIGLILPILLPAKDKNSALSKNDYLVFSLLSALITVALWSLAWENEPSGTYYNRYIFNLYGFTIIGFSLLTDKAIHLARLNKANQKLILPAIVFTAIAATQSSNAREAFITFSNHSNPYADLIQNHTNSGGKIYVLTDQQGFKGSRGIKANTNERIWASSIGSDGSANPWDQGKSEFRKGNSREIKDYSMIMTNPSNTETMIKRYGDPQNIITDNQLDVSLLIYSTEKSISSIKKSIKRSLKGEFKIQCPSPIN